MCCDHFPKFRRDACRSCYRKLGEAGLLIGPDRRPPANAAAGIRQAAARLSGAEQARLDGIVARMKPDARARLEAALAKARGT